MQLERDIAEVPNKEKLCDRSMGIPIDAEERARSAAAMEQPRTESGFSVKQSCHNLWHD